LLRCLRVDLNPTTAVVLSFLGGASGVTTLFFLGAAALSARRRNWPFAAGRLLWSLPFLAFTAYAARYVLRAMGLI
jgi:hypothetical protein